MAFAPKKVTGKRQAEEPYDQLDPRWVDSDIADTEGLNEILLRSYYRGKDGTGYSDFELRQDIRQIQAKSKENYKRLALELIGDDDFEFRNGMGRRQSKQVSRNEHRAEQRATLSNQLNNMKGE